MANHFSHQFTGRFDMMNILLSASCWLLAILYKRNITPELLLKMGYYTVSYAIMYLPQINHYTWLYK